MRALMAGVAVLSLVAVGCGGDKSGGSNSPAYSCDKVQPAGFPVAAEGLEVGDTLPDQNFVDLEGNARCTRDFTSKPLFINIATGWCPPCQSETPGFQTVYEEFKNDGFVLVQAMFENYDGGNPDADFMQEWKDEYDITFLLVPDTSEDFWNNLLPPSNTGYVPHNIIVNKDGVISYTNYGGMSESQLRTRVNALVNTEPTLVFEE
jgi:thiol-disulfide isomerase/thioredoxin